MFFLSAPLMSQLNEITGIVFNDMNMNGVKDPGEYGLKAIPVSNGDTIVLTNNKGFFLIHFIPGCSIFPVLPSNYELHGVIKNSCFKYISEVPYTKGIIEIPLIKKKQSECFRIGVIGDLQVGDMEEINYANQTVMAEFADRKDLNFNIFLGDLVNDDTTLLPFVDAMLKRIFSPSWTVIGNHDRELSSSFQDSTFNSLFGASNYAFNYSNVHFIVLNNIWSEGGRRYEGRFTDQQLRFVANDLSFVPDERLVVICQHIPMFFVRNREQMLALFSVERKVLILSGHTHQISRYIFSDNISELVAGASCGNWWVGEKDWQGIPQALMQCGAPRNYFVIDFNKNEYSLSYKGIGLDENRQMDIWINGQDTIDKYIDGFADMDKGAVIANIYAGSENTEVYMQVDDGSKIKMEKADVIAPNASRLISLNKTGSYPTMFSRKAALRRSPSSHVWKANLPSGLSSGLFRITIWAEDKYGFKATGSRLFLF